MRKKSEITRRSRRAVIGSLATGLAGVATVTSNGIAAVQDGRALYEGDDGVLVTAAGSSSLSSDQITRTRERARSLHPLLAQDLYLAEPDATPASDGYDEIVAYYLGYDSDRGGLQERFWSAPPSATRTRRNVIEARAKAATSGFSASSADLLPNQWGDDPIDAGPGWEHVTTVNHDRYLERNLGGETFTLGRVDIMARLYRSDSSQGTDDSEEYGLGLTFLQWPGDYLDEYDSAVSKGSGFNREAKAELTLTYEPTAAPELIDFAPSSDDGSWFSCLDLEGVSIGVSGKTPSGSITVSPSAKGINEIVNRTDPDDSVITSYEYGGFFGQDRCGGDEVIRAGNSAAFYSDTDRNLAAARTWGTFQARENGDVVEDTIRTGYALQPQ